MLLAGGGRPVTVHAFVQSSAPWLTGDEHETRPFACMSSLGVENRNVGLAKNGLCKLQGGAKRPKQCQHNGNIGK